MDLVFCYLLFLLGGQRSRSAGRVEKSASFIFVVSHVHRDERQLSSFVSSFPILFPIYSRVSQDAGYTQFLRFSFSVSGLEK